MPATRAFLAATGKTLGFTVEMREINADGLSLHGDGKVPSRKNRNPAKSNPENRR